MAKSTACINALEKRVDEIFAWIDEYLTYKGLTTELESVCLALELQDKHIEALEEKIKHLLAVVAKLSSGEGTVDDIKDDIKEIVSTIQGELVELKGKVNLLVRVVSNPHVGAYEVGKAKILERKAFGGVRDAKEIDNFLFDMELYFNATKNDSDEGRASERQKTKTSSERGLMCVDLSINGKAIRALVDMGATDNFITDKMASRFKLNIQEDVGKIKAINSKALNTTGIVRGASC
ncbi:hypothetical protein GH714_016266 [Hevea brasiliensis]|uniref:Uncharacterized protein n=1 Tax=Hevea brasiliensis TaxID=3981 RepID=A0A6A6K6I2_HEVBR|nr:hypothetical protein GH714_016266 [Hevea brasiliensis]